MFGMTLSLLFCNWLGFLFSPYYTLTNTYSYAYSYTYRN